MNVKWDESICTHSGHCVQSLPNVFKIENGEFVIDTEQESEMSIAKTVNECPSGALDIED